MLDKIIKIFYGDLFTKLTINELSSKTGVSYSYVYGQVEKLNKNGILLIEERSNRKYCRPNYNNIGVKTAFVKVSGQIAEDYLNKKDKIFFIIEKLISELSKKTNFNLLSIVLFGSLVKGTSSKKSDMDLFIIVPSKEKYDEAIEMECVALSKSFGVEINPVISEPASLLTMLRDKGHNIGKDILKNKIILFGAEKFWELVFEVIK